MIRVLIVEDEAPARAKLRQWLADSPDMEVVGEASDGAAALAAVAAHAPHVVFLDIQIPQKNGLAVADEISARDGPLVVFVTAYGEHALEAFDSNAIDYLLKPYDKERFSRALNRVRARLGRLKVGPNRLLLPIRDELQVVDCSEITHIRAEGNYVRVYANERSYLLRRTLQEMLSELAPTTFIRIHRSCVVNIDQIRGVKALGGGAAEVQLKTSERLRVSKGCRSELLKQGWAH